MLAANAACRGCHSRFARHPHAAPAAARRADRQSRHRPAALPHAGELLDAHDIRGDDVDDCRRRGSSVGSPEACGSSIESAESNGLARAVCDEPRSRICAAIMTGLTSAPDGSDHRLRPAAAVCAVRARRVNQRSGWPGWVRASVSWVRRTSSPPSRVRRARPKIAISEWLRVRTGVLRVRPEFILSVHMAGPPPNGRRHASGSARPGKRKVRTCERAARWPAG